MARGWESKGVEAQQAEKGQTPPSSKRKLTAQEAARWREQENLRLAREAILNQLSASHNPVRHKQLEEALKSLEARLADLAVEPPH